MTSWEIGKLGEDCFINYCKENGIWYQDLRDVKMFWSKDIDFKTNNHTYEVKTTLSAGDDFLCSVRRNGKRVGWSRTKADYIYLYRVAKSMVYILDRPKV